MEIHESAENYLETIYILKKKLGNVRSIDICNELGFSKPTVSVAMKNFHKEGYIEKSADGFIDLTDKGTEIAKKMYERHVAIAEFFMSIGVDRETAFKDSCKIEHDISPVTFECMKKHYEQFTGKKLPDIN
ncbi:MAG: metal-dependent transcriptional regulator [Ruminococcus sp.]